MRGVGSIVALLALAAPASVSATPAPVLRGTASGPAAADARYAAFPTNDTSVHVIYTATAERHDVTAPDGCSFADVGGGQALWSYLADERDNALLLDLRTGAVPALAAPYTRLTT